MLVLLGAAASACSPEEVPNTLDDPARPGFVGDTPRTMAAVRAAYIEAMQSEVPEAYHVTREGALVARSPAQGLRTAFTDEGAQVEQEGKDAAAGVSLAAVRWGCADRLEPLAGAAPEAQDNRVHYQRAAGLVEWYKNGPLGLEQGFTLEAAPACRSAGGGELTIEVALGGGLQAALAPDGAALTLRDADGRVALRYTDLFARDAAGRTLPAHFELAEGGVSIRVDDAGAAYPVVIDPLVWVEQTMFTPSDAMTYDTFGQSVAIEGNTAMVGSIGASNLPSGPWATGAVYVYERINGSFTQVQKLFAADAVNQDLFGWSVAMRGDTAIIGARHKYHNGSGAGVAYAFVRQNGVWVQQAKLAANETTSAFGYSVAFLSDDRVVIGGPFRTNGAAYVFGRNNGVWTQEAKLVAANPGSTDQFGAAVAGDGNTIVIGSRQAFYQNDVQQRQTGKAEIFEYVNGAWTETAVLQPADLLSNGSHFGSSVAIQGDTIAIGEIGDATYAPGGGAVYIYERSGGAWAQATKLFPVDATTATNAYFGISLALHDDTLAVGASGHREQAGNAGAVYTFQRTNGAWSPWNKRLAQNGGGGYSLGQAIALGSDVLLASAPGSGPTTPYSPGRVHVFTTQPALSNGAACSVDTQCASLFCVDGVCCDSACGGGEAVDCQACSVATGAPSDGTCSTFSAGTVCRAAGGVCDVAEVCDGVGGACPQNAWKPAGTVCSAGTNACDADETCTGLSALCPADLGPTLTCATPCATPSFSTGSTLSTGTGSPQAVRTGDFNGDGKIDLVTANESSGRLSLFLGNGTGGFTSSGTISVGGGPRDVAVADFDHDGADDLAVADAANNQVVVYLGTGTGTFGARTNHAVGNLPVTIDVADFDEDGHLDIITGNRDSDSVTILHGTGSGSFGGATAFGTSAYAPRTVKVADFNGDGRADVATANVMSGGKVRIQLGSGTGSLALGDATTVGNNPRGLAARDFDGDGNVDLVTGVDNANAVKVMLGNGDGSFATPTSFTTGTQPYFVTPGDYNGDGKLDIAVANAGSDDVSILLGDGAGSFGAPTHVTVGDTPHMIVAADFDGDADLDLAVANSLGKSVSILINGCACALSCSP
uniref:Disintegrin domain-containing protein n=1 Tax=myxobacterium MSr12020 TaxID=2993535 RepID=A0A9E8IIG1_9BACT|nr:hypothetical protein [myxobacterium MSr12020]